MEAVLLLEDRFDFVVIWLRCKKMRHVLVHLQYGKIRNALDISLSERAVLGEDDMHPEAVDFRVPEFVKARG